MRPPLIRYRGRLLPANCMNRCVTVMLQVGEIALQTKMIPVRYDVNRGETDPWPGTDTGPACHGMCAVSKMGRRSGCSKMPVNR